MYGAPAIPPWSFMGLGCLHGSASSKRQYQGAICLTEQSEGVIATIVGFDKKSTSQADTGPSSFAYFSVDTEKYGFASLSKEDTITRPNSYRY